MIVLDTNVLIDALTGPRRSSQRLREEIADGQRLVLPALVLYEWLRGPRLDAELEAQEAIVPSSEALAFGPAEAAVAARLCASVSRPRGRKLDLAIAAHALARDASLWTLGSADFDDLPGVRLVPG